MKKAIIIGATSGLGRDAAARLVADGWAVGIAGRRTEALETFRLEHPSATIYTATMDVTSEDCIATLDVLINQLGAPDLLFYVSGVGQQNPELDIDKEITMVKTNCEGMVRIVDHFVNYVRSHKEYYKQKAQVAVITSVAGVFAMGSAPAYAASKRMQSTYLSALAQLSRMEDIPVCFTDIRPGFVDTAILNPDKHYPVVMSRETAANHIMKAIKQRRRVYTFDWRFRALCFVGRFIPRFIWERLTCIKN